MTTSGRISSAKFHYITLLALLLAPLLCVCNNCWLLCNWRRVLFVFFFFFIKSFVHFPCLTLNQGTDAHTHIRRQESAVGAVDAVIQNILWYNRVSRSHPSVHCVANDGIYIYIQKFAIFVFFFSSFSLLLTMFRVCPFKVLSSTREHSTQINAKYMESNMMKIIVV